MSVVPDVPKDPGKQGNNNLVSPSKSWCFTLNNFTKSDIDYILSVIIPFGEVMFENEVGDEGTPHIQGFVHFNNKKRPLEVFKMENLHTAEESPTNEKGWMNFLKAGGTETDSWYYCTEDYRRKIPGCQVYSSNYPTFRKWLKAVMKVNLLTKRIATCKYPYDKLLKHQKDVVDLVLNTEPDDRSIHVWWSKKYSTGKTQTLRYLLVNHPELIVQIPSGKASDILNRIIETDMDYVKAVMLNLTAEESEDYPISALESIKDACIACGKYKGGAKIFDYVHVIIFANRAPHPNVFEVIDKNRWIINEITD